MSCSTHPPGCLNALFDLTGRTRDSGDILDDFDLSITSCAQAMSVAADRLEKRLSASDVVVMSGSDTLFTLEMRIGRDEATVTMKPAANCNYPITADYVKGTDSGSAQFQTIDDLVNWLVKRLRT